MLLWSLHSNIPWKGICRLKYKIEGRNFGNKREIEMPIFMESDRKFSPGECERVPIGSWSRGYEMISLGASLSMNTIGSAIRENIWGENTDKRGLIEHMSTEENARMLGERLCKMRGAALKLGQTLSMLDSSMVPEIVRLALIQARANANPMPQDQLIQVLDQELGTKWTEELDLDIHPVAAASIGQVHYATIKQLHKEHKEHPELVLKVQYPGISESIVSDLENFRRVAKALRLFPPQLFLDELIREVTNELTNECNYLLEAQKQIEYKQVFSLYSEYYVPTIYPKYTTSKVICMERIHGIPIDDFDYSQSSQLFRDHLGELFFKLILRELFVHQFSQTDPNPANYYFHTQKLVLNLIDFGAARKFDLQFMKAYRQIMIGVSMGNDTMIRESLEKCGFLTGEENRKVLKGHISLAKAVGDVFADNHGEIYDFGKQAIMEKVYKLINDLTHSRLAAPPDGITALDRKLIGCFLQLVRFRARVPTRKIFLDIVQQTNHFYNGI